MKYEYELPGPSATAWIFVVFPPRLMPINWLCWLFTALFSTCTVRMCLNHCGIQGQIFHLRILIQGLKYAQKSALIMPFTKPTVYRFQWSIPCRDICSPAPLRVSHSMAFSMRRSSFQGRPIPDWGIKSLTRSHGSSVHSQPLFSIFITRLILSHLLDFVIFYFSETPWSERIPTIFLRPCGNGA